MTVNSGDVFSDIYKNAPTLQGSPSLVLAAANSNDPTGTAVSLAAANDGQAMDKAKQHVDAQHPGFLGSILHAGMVGLEQLGRPLGEVQHQYRWLRDVEARHGLWTSLALSVGTYAVGGGLGLFLGGPAGAVAGAALAGKLVGSGLNVEGDSYDLTKNGQNYRLDGRPVSPGRDLSNLLGFDNTSKGAGKWISGLTDAGFDVVFDPLLSAGKLSSVARGTREVTDARGFVARTILPDHAIAGEKFLSQFAPSRALSNPDQIAKTITRPSLVPGVATPVQRALDDIANSSAVDIATRYPVLNSVAPQLGKMTTREQVGQFFIDAAAGAEWTRNLNTSMLPSRTVSRALFSRASEGLKNISGTDKVDEMGFVPAVAQMVRNPGNAPDLLKKAISQKVRTFSGYKPFYIKSDSSLALSANSFDPSDPAAGAKVVYDVMRFSMSHNGAKDVAAQFINAGDNLALKKQIYQQGIVDMFKAAGAPDDAPFMARVKELSEQAVLGDTPGELYSVGWETGEANSKVALNNASPDLALYHHQRGSFMVPNFRELNSVVRQASKYKRLYGTLDDFATDHYTSKFFKPMALFSLGFALRVAASEMIGVAFRHGFGNVIKSYRSISQGKKLAADERENIAAAALHTLDGVPGGVAGATSDDVALAMRLVEAGDGQFVRGAASTGHGMSIYGHETGSGGALGEKIQGLIQRDRGRQASEFESGTVGALGQIKNRPKAWVRATPDNTRYGNYWVNNLQKRSTEASVRIISRDISAAVKANGGKDLTHDQLTKIIQDEAARISGNATGYSKDVLASYARDANVLTRTNVQDPMEWAAARVDDVRGVTYGADGTIHTDLLDKLGAGVKPTREDIGHIPVESAPRAVVGRPDFPPARIGRLERITELGYKKFIDPTINRLSREPMWFLAVKKEMANLKWAVDNNFIDDASAFTIAQRRAANAILPQIHNTLYRSQFSVLANNFLPFYFAQEQALKRAGNLIGTHPEALYKYTVIEHMLNDPTFVETDPSTGSQYLMIPGLGQFSHVFDLLAGVGLKFQGGLPMSVSGNLKSLQSVLPEIQQPGVSPIMALSMKALGSMFPELQPAAEGVAGQIGYNQSALQMIIPNSALRNAVLASGLDPGRSYGSALTTAMMAAAYNGDLPPANDPARQQEFIDKLKNTTRSMFLFKALLSAVSPLSPKVELANTALRDEFRQMLKEYPTYAEALTAFSKKEGPNAAAYTIAKSESTTGASFPYTEDVHKWLTQNSGLVKKYHYGASFLIPQNESANQQISLVYNDALNMQLRQVKTPQEFLNSVFIQQGDSKYFAAKAIHDAAAANLSGQALAAENANWQAYVQQMALQSPIWYDNFTSTERTNRARIGYNQLQQIFANNEAPDTEQSRGVANLMQAYASHQAALASLPDRSAAKSAEQDNWAAYLDSKAKSDPRLSNVIDGVFKRLG